MICLCCGSSEISELKEVGGPTKHICKTCGARVPSHGDPVRRCPVCKEAYFDIEDEGDISTFVHKRARNAQGQLVNFIWCTRPTSLIGGFVSGAELLGGRA